MAFIKTYNDWLAYMHSIATANKSLNPSQLAESDHFYPFTESLTTNDLNSPCLVMMPEDYGIKDSGSDNIHLAFHPEFWISEAVPVNDQVAEKEALQRCFDLAWDVLSFIYEDYNKLGYNPNKKMAELDLSSVRIQEHQPWGKDRLIGFRVMFSFANPKHLTKSNNWW
jgi:hypothetical protein